MENTFETYHTKKREDLHSYRLIRLVCFTIFLPIACVARVCGWRWRPWAAGPEGYGSVFQEARLMSSTVASLAISV